LRRRKLQRDKNERLKKRTEEGILWHLNRVQGKTGMRKSGKLSSPRKPMVPEIGRTDKSIPIGLNTPLKRRNSAEKQYANPADKKPFEVLKSLTSPLPSIKPSPSESKTKAQTLRVSFDANPDPLFTEYPATSPPRREEASIGEVLQSALERIDGLLRKTSLLPVQTPGA
jgi:hypothetical protein